MKTDKFEKSVYNSIQKTSVDALQNNDSAYSRIQDFLRLICVKIQDPFHKINWNLCNHIVAPHIASHTVKDHLLFLRELRYESLLIGASVMSSRLRMKRIVSLLSLLTGATKTLHRNLLPETTQGKNEINSLAITRATKTRNAICKVCMTLSQKTTTVVKKQEAAPKRSLESLC